MNYDKAALALHKKFQGKLETIAKTKLKTKEDLSKLYTPGVAAVSRAISKNKALAKELTLSGRTIAIISDGSAILGLGNLGPEAAMPVMEGKAILFKNFAGVDAFPIVLASQDTEEIIQAVKMIAPTFGGINLEDISAPRCFEIEARLKKELSIPVFHDDQHGTAIVVFAGLLNALRVVKKQIEKVRVVVSGAGAAALATTNMMILGGVSPRNIIIVDSKGTLHKGRKDLNIYKSALAQKTNGRNITLGLEEALKGADVFVGVSAPNILKKEWVAAMAERPIAFAMANPDPEISFKDAQKTKLVVFGTGRSDYPNQINNVLAFPGVFKGALAVKAKAITEPMKLAAAFAIARLVSPAEIKKGIVIPKPFDTRVAKKVAAAVARASNK